MGLKGKSYSLGYTDINVDGKVTMQGDTLAGLVTTNDVTLTTDQCTATVFEVATGSDSKALIIPAAVAAQYAGKFYVVANADSSLDALIKVAGGTAVTIAQAKSAIVRINSAGTEVVRVTSDS